jgi:hypothetical protein
MMERAVYARTLLLDSTFLECYQELLDELLDQMMRAAPRETEERERIAMQLWALQAIAGRLNHWHQRAQLLEEGREETPENE